MAHGNFAQMGELATATNFAPVDGILLDLGLSSDQLADRERGFSFAHDAPLDMRFDTTRGVSAADLVNTLPEAELADRALALWRGAALAGHRPAHWRGASTTPITRTGELARLVAGVVHGRPGGIHPATRTFQALRIAVNDELASLETALPAAIELLRPGGRLAVISFHSLEDRIVKQTFQREERGCVCPPELPECVCGRAPRLRIVTRHPLTASVEEIATNPRARSAKLRVAEKPCEQGNTRRNEEARTMARRTSTAHVHVPAPVIDLAEARRQRASRAPSSAAARSAVATCAITAPMLRLPVTRSSATSATPPPKPRGGVRRHFGELRTALADGWEIVQPIFARPLWSVLDDSTTAFNFVLRRATDTRLVTVPEGRTVERFIRDRQLTVDYRR